MPNIKMKTAHVAASTGSGTQDFTIAGFDSTVVGVIFEWCGGTGIGVAGVDCMPGRGYCDGTRNVSVCALSDHNVTTGDTSRRITNAACLSFIGENQTSIGSFSFNSFITNGVRLNIGESAEFGYLVQFTLIGTDNIANIYCNAFDDLGTGTAAVPIDVAGFEPDLAFVDCVGHTGLPTGSTNIHTILSHGCAINDGSETQRVSMATSWDNLTAPASECHQYIGNTAIIGRLLQGTMDWTGALTSFNANGFSITPSASAVNTNLIYMVIKFTDKPQLALADFEWPTTGNLSITTPGFLPLYARLSTILGPTARNAIKANTSYTLNMAVLEEQPGQRARVMNSSEEHGVTTTNASSEMNSTLDIRKPDSSGSDVVASSWTMTSLGADFTLTTNPAAVGLSWGLFIGSNNPNIINHTLRIV